VSLRGLDIATGGTGIDVRHGNSFCQTGASTGRRVLIQDNIVLGPGDNVQDATYSGIKLDRVCGSSNRHIDVLENDVEEWRYAGLEVYESSDIQVSCNRIEGNRRGVQVTWSGSTPTPVRFRENVVRALVQNAGLHSVGTNHVGVTALGTDTSTRGDNRITARRDSTMLVRNTGGTSLDATYNFWFTNANGDAMANDVRLVVQDSILARAAGSVDVSNFNETLPSWDAPRPTRRSVAAARGSCRAGSPRWGRGPHDRSSQSRIAHGPRPRKPFPNPSRGVVDIALAIPSQDVGRYMLEVFDVAGSGCSRGLGTSRARATTASDGVVAKKTAQSSGPVCIPEGQGSRVPPASQGSLASLRRDVMTTSKTLGAVVAFAIPLAAHATTLRVPSEYPRSRRGSMPRWLATRSWWLLGRTPTTRLAARRAHVYSPRAASCSSRREVLPSPRSTCPAAPGSPTSSSETSGPRRRR